MDLAKPKDEHDRFVESLERRIESFCASAPLSELTVTLHSTGVNYAHQFYVLSLIGRRRLSQFKQVNFVSGSVIAAIVYYSYQTGQLQWGRHEVPVWERHFFTSHELHPIRAALRHPRRLLRGRPILSRNVQMKVIRSGIGEDFGRESVSFFPKNFRFWLFDKNSADLKFATADNHLNVLRLDELAVAATSVPRLFYPFETGEHSFIDPMFSPARKKLSARLREASGPMLISNMLVDRASDDRHFLRPHLHANGHLLMLRELLRFCFGLRNLDHVKALETGLLDLGSKIR